MANNYNPIFNFTDKPKTSDIWVVTNNLTNNIIQLHNIFFTVFHKVAHVNVYKTGNDKGIFFEWV